MRTLTELALVLERKGTHYLFTGPRMPNFVVSFSVAIVNDTAWVAKFP